VKSILQDERECYITGCTTMLVKHHIYQGHGLRRISEDNGFWIWVRSDIHTGSNKSIHGNQELNMCLRKTCQRKFEQTHSRDEFMKLIGFNYLWEEEDNE